MKKREIEIISDYRSSCPWSGESSWKAAKTILEILDKL